MIKKTVRNEENFVQNRKKIKIQFCYYIFIYIIFYLIFFSDITFVKKKKIDFKENRSNELAKNCFCLYCSYNHIFK